MKPGRKRRGRPGRSQPCRLLGSVLHALAVTYELCHCSQGPDENISKHALAHVTLPVMLALYMCRGVHACTHRHIFMYMHTSRVYVYCMLHYSPTISAGRRHCWPGVLKLSLSCTNLHHTSSASTALSYRRLAEPTC